MSIKRRMLSFFLLTFMVISSLLVIGESYAYWMGGAAGASDNATINITTGEWNQAFEWDPNATYSTGDRVINNGITYEARRDNPTREPGVGGGWRSEWTQID